MYSEGRRPCTLRTEICTEPAYIVIDMVGTNRDPASAIRVSTILPAVTELAPDFMSLLDRDRSVQSQRRGT
jgi:hypothetical protein